MYFIELKIMSLAKYKEKRSFDKTPEPIGGKPTDNKLHFVVQKHHASHLHYDFRLEMEGVLKSWAVPKGPSMNPEEKRLAMMVEDHPWDYKDFEGIIPSGYGAGTVIVWDEGTYEPTEKKKTKKENEKSLMHHLYQGSISFVLKGKKLKGEFSLVKTEGRGENAWLLIKKDDRYASKDEISKKDKSVLSHKTLEQVRAHPEKEWKSNRAQKTKGIPESTDRKTEESENVDIDVLLKKGNKSRFPKDVSPMLCTLIKEPFTDPKYLYEVKFDGYRIIGYVNKGKVTLSSRSGLDYTQKYPSVAKELKKLDADVILDGEIVALNKEGHPDFDALQKNTGETPLAFYLFDLLYYKGYDVEDLPLIERKEILSRVIPFNQILKFSDHFDDGMKLYDLIKEQQMEGIVAKRKESKYQAGKRNNDWLKLPTEKRQEFVVGGWAESSNSRAFRSLLFGAYNEDKKLEWIGRSGGGYKDKDMPAILKKLKALETDESPFVNKILDTKGAKIHYVKPELVANFKFATWTTSGRIRKPATFLGFRNDKKPKNVVREIPLTKGEEQKIVAYTTTEESKTKAAKEKPENSNWPELEQIPITSEDKIQIENCTVALTNIEKEIWPGVTKADLITYYNSIASYILPHLKNRPLSLHLKPYGAKAPGLYIKDMEGREPDCAAIFSTKRKHPKKGKRNIIDYLVCNNTPTLLYLINLGCIDVNPWTSTTDDYLHPNYIIIDLDPSDADFNKVVKTALAAKKVFDKLKIKAFPKTSGKTGMHLYIPCEGFSFPEARSIAVNICKKINEQVPEISTVENTISKRGDKLFIDYNQNDEADTVAAPYSVRPTTQPTVSTPLEWKEINDKLDFKTFTIHTILERIKIKGDLFEGVMDEKIRKRNSNILKQL
jgi:bifunctional non-homologous end joining protein LigD